MKTISNSIRELRRYYASMLCDIYCQDEANTLILMILKHYFGYDKVTLALNPELCLNDSEIKILDDSVNELLTNRPIQYVIGKTEFCGIDFIVNENVLIPRPETEELVGLIRDERLEIRDEREEMRDERLEILDVGTGSGCIAVSLAMLLNNSHVTAIDVSEGALKVARANAKANAVEIDFIQADILLNPSFCKTFDVIVSNPPYVSESEKTEMRDNVLDFEPSTALFVSDNDPLIFYRHIVAFAKDNLNLGGTLWFEINERFGDETAQLCTNYGFTNVIVINDFFGKNRFVKAKL